MSHVALFGKEKRGNREKEKRESKERKRRE